MQLLAKVLNAFPCCRSLKFHHCDMQLDPPVVSEGVVELMTNLTSLSLDDCPVGATGLQLGALGQLQELKLECPNTQPIIISEAARLTSLRIFTKYSITVRTV
jgi:hypothetical protein